MSRAARDQRFAGRSALVTGAAQGIGFAIAGRLLDEGGRVVLFDRNREALEAARGALAARGEAIAAAGDTAGRGAIVVTASTNAFFPEQHTAHYSAAKGGVVAFVRAVALDLAESGIRVNAVSPGIIRTPLAAPLTEDPAAAGEFLRAVPMSRFGECDEIADTVLFLASDESSYITGQNIVVDGGTTLGMSIGQPGIVMPDSAG